MPASALPAQRERFEALGRLELGISNAGVAEMLGQIVERVTRLMAPGVGLSVVLWNEADRTFETSASTVPGQQPELAARRVRSSRGASRWIVEHDEGLLIDHIDRDPFGANSMLREYGMLTYLGLPIPGDPRPLGVLYAMAPEPGSLDGADLEFLRIVATRAAGAIQVGIERDRTVQMLDRSRALHTIAATLNSSEPLEAELEQVCEVLRRAVGATAAAIAPHRSSADVLPRTALAGPTLRAGPRPDTHGLVEDLGYQDPVFIHPFGEPVAGWFAFQDLQARHSDVRRFLAVVGEQLVAAIGRERDLHALQASNAALSDFAHVVSHDLKTPLSSIVGFIDLLRDRLSESGDDVTMEFLRRTDASARRLAMIIDALLEHAMQRGQPLDATDVALHTVVGRVVEDLEAQIEITDANVTVLGRLPTITADTTAVGIAVQNLIANGLKYTRDGTTPKVTITATRDDSKVRLIVADEGTGVPPDEVDAVFRLFDRGSQRAKPGLGIGLATVRALVSRMNGNVWLEPNQPYGTRAVIELPAAQDAEGDADAAP